MHPESGNCKYLSSANIKSYLSKSRRLCTLFDEYLNSKIIKNKFPEWEQDFNQWCEDQRESLTEALEQIYMEQDHIN